MGKLRHEGDWVDVKERLMDKYPALTEQDFKNEDHEEKLLGHISQKVGVETDELRKMIREI